MSNSKKLPDLSEKSVESINSGDSRLAANLNINCSEVRRLMHRRKYRTITNFLQRSARICRLPKSKSRCTIMTRCAFI